MRDMPKQPRTCPGCGKTVQVDDGEAMDDQQIRAQTNKRETRMLNPDLEYLEGIRAECVRERQGSRAVLLI